MKRQIIFNFRNYTQDELDNYFVCSSIITRLYIHQRSAREYSLYAWLIALAVAIRPSMQSEWRIELAQRSRQLPGLYRTTSATFARTLSIGGLGDFICIPVCQLPSMIILTRFVEKYITDLRAFVEEIHRDCSQRRQCQVV